MFLRRQRSATRAGQVGDDSRSVASRRVRHRLPTSRAVLGGILVTVAAAGVLIAHREASAPPRSRYVVMTRAVDAGEVVTSDDLGTIALDLPAELQVVPAADVDQLTGRRARTRLSELDILRPDDLFEAGRFADPTTVEVAIELSPARALIGSVEVGSVVDILSTDPSSTGTSTVASSVAVTGLDAPDLTGIGTDGVVVARLAVADSTVAEAVTDAAVRTEVSFALPAPSAEVPA